MPSATVLFGGLCVLLCGFGVRNVVGQDTASLEAELLPGSLSIDPNSIAGTITPITGAGTTTDRLQRNAVVFVLEDIRVTDFDGDGRGFRLVAEPEPLINPGPGVPFRRRLPLGQLKGFSNPSLPENCVIKNRRRGHTQYSTLRYVSGAGVDLEVDLELAYHIPAFAEVGEYSGVVKLSVTAD